MEKHPDHYSLSGGEVTLWVEQEAIHIKAIPGERDPAKLTKEQALQLTDIPKAIPDKIDD